MSMREELVRRVLIYHCRGIDPDTLGDLCLCGWSGRSWTGHVAPLVVGALFGPGATLADTLADTGPPPE